MTDATGDDIAEYLAPSRTVRLRAGTGATAAAGGTLGINSTISFRFRATVDRAASGTVLNNTAALAYRARTIGKDFTFIGNTVSTPVATLADLQIGKTSTPTALAGGGSVTYAADRAEQRADRGGQHGDHRHPAARGRVRLRHAAGRDDLHGQRPVGAPAPPRPWPTARAWWCRSWPPSPPPPRPAP